VDFRKRHLSRFESHVMDTLSGIFCAYCYREGQRTYIEVRIPTSVPGCNAPTRPKAGNYTSHSACLSYIAGGSEMKRLSPVVQLTAPR
jgi:hypothetical protein